MAWFHDWLLSAWQLTVDISLWLLIGLFLAGCLHVLIPISVVRRHFGGTGLGSIFRAVFLGVPLPLCSCGVIPTAIGFHRQGASRPASMGFLIATPQTGVDSILVSAGFLGFPFALFKVLAALVSGLIGGVAMRLVDGPNGQSPAPQTTCPHCGAEASPSQQEIGPAWLRLFHFGFVTLLRDIYLWLIAGIALAAVLSLLLPSGSLSDVAWAQGLPGMLLMLLVSLPMYICATGSVPLAATLVTAGMSPGAALVLLMAGPVTNVATVGAIFKAFGARALAVYLITVSVMSLLAGVIFNRVLEVNPDASGHLTMVSHGVLVTAAVVLLALMVLLFLQGVWARFKHRGHDHHHCH